MSALRDIAPEPEDATPDAVEIAPVGPADLDREAFRLMLRDVARAIGEADGAAGDMADPPRTDRLIAHLRAKADACDHILAVDRIVARFGLEPLDLSLIALACLADGVDGPMPGRARASGRPTAALACRLFGDEALERLSPEAPLHRHGLLSLADAHLPVGERVLRTADSVGWTLRGRAGVSEALIALARPAPAPGFPLGRDAAVELGRLVLQSAAQGGAVRLGVCTRDPEPVLATLRAALISVGTEMVRLGAGDLGGADMRGLARDVTLSGAFPVVELDDARTDNAASLLSRLTGPALLLGPDAGGLARLGVLRIDARLGDTGGRERRARLAVDLGLASDTASAAGELAGGEMGPLATRITTRANWEDLILPGAQMTALRRMSEFLAHRRTVCESWGFGAKSARGLGMAALFHGPSGTGKTTAAEILVREMRGPDGEPGHVPLYRVDTSALVSKYIGDTAKNIAAVFESGRRAGAALLFDEAEGLFAKRSSSGRDSLDKHANAELGFLLQCLEDYPGVAILTTNMRDLIDEAFARRFRFVIEFPFPDRTQREAIWAGVVPPDAPCDALDAAALSRLPLSGGNIRSIAVNAAFAAAAEGRSMGMRHMAEAARMELLKLRKPVPESVLAGWARA